MYKKAIFLQGFTFAYKNKLIYYFYKPYKQKLVSF